MFMLLLALLPSTALPAGATTHTRHPKGAVRTVKDFEWRVHPDLAFAAAGKVTFEVKNTGIYKHEFVMVRVPPSGVLPTKADGSLNEDAIPTTDKVADLGSIKVKHAKSVTKTLTLGKYVMFCNLHQKLSNGTVVSHYAKGMHAAFTVG
jgi:hypothetical protein